MLGEVHQLVQQGATAASELRSLAYEHKVRVASAAGLLEKIGNRVAVVEQLMADQVKRRSAGRITVATPEQGTGNRAPL